MKDKLLTILGYVFIAAVIVGTGLACAVLVIDCYIGIFD